MEPLPLTNCPWCLAVRRSQGFDVVIDDKEPLCSSCLQCQKNNEYFESEDYKTWLASKPPGMTVEETYAWIATHPPP